MIIVEGKLSIRMDRNDTLSEVEFYSVITIDRFSIYHTYQKFDNTLLSGSKAAEKD